MKRLFTFVLPTINFKAYENIALVTSDKSRFFWEKVQLLYLLKTTLILKK
jgi:hypothetical protein